MKHSHKIIILTVIIGILSGIMGVLLKLSVHSLFTLISTDTFAKKIIFIFPFIGILSSYFLIDFIFKGKIKKGLTGVLFSIARKSGILSRHSIWLHPTTTTLSVGLGASAGIEAPIVATSAAIGSVLARKFRFRYEDRILMIAAGTAAGIASVFNAPIAGVMFAIEVLLPRLNVSNFIPLMIASAAGAICSRILLHGHVLLSFVNRESFNYQNVPFYIGLGILCGAMSLYYIQITHKIDEIMDTKTRSLKLATLGAILVSAMCFLFPPLMSEGSKVIHVLGSNDPFAVVEQFKFSFLPRGELFLLIGLFLVALLKPIAVALTVNSGGNGGNFGPSLLVGAITGFCFSSILQKFLAHTLPIGNFALVGMAGILSGVMHAPLTAIFLIAEITGGYELFIPLLIVSSISFLLSKRYHPFSVDTKKLGLKNDILTHNQDHNALILMNITKVIERDVFQIRPNLPLKKLIILIKKSKRNIFAVTNEKNEFLGTLYFDDIKKVIFDEKLRNSKTVSEFIRQASEVVLLSDSMIDVVMKFNCSKNWNLPVLNEGKYIGFVSKARFFDAYREQIKSPDNQTLKN